MFRPASWLFPLVGGVAALGLGCILNLNQDIACGDGYLDAAAGEKCDPLVPGSYELACAEIGLEMGTADCDPETCQIIATPEQCAVCGDGNVDEGEQCDGDNKNGATCPLGGLLGCKDCKFDVSACNTCGNGIVEETEECDPAQEVGGLVKPVSCVGLPPLVKAYSSGTVSFCKDDCKWSRATCGYCGDNILDGPTPLDPDFDNIMSVPEKCDGPLEVDPDALREYCSDVCGSSLNLKCAWSCADNCRGFDQEDIAPPDLGCCRAQGEACPLPNDEFPCCWAVTNPDKPGEECETVIDGGAVQDLCR